MKTSSRLRLLPTLPLGVILASPVLGEVVASEFFSDPQTEGWQLLGEQGNVRTWVEDGVFYQDLPHNCPPGPVCDQQGLRRSIQSFNGHPTWFYEYRVSATGDRREIPAAAPTVLAAANAFGIVYHATVASDQVKLARAVDLPIHFIDLEPGILHTIRLELYNATLPTYRWFLDGLLVDEGLAEGPFPARDARITWLGGTWNQPTVNRWDYIRFGDIPADASGDFDSNEAVGSADFYFLHECLTNERLGIHGGPNESAGPGCRWADFDYDSDVDLLDLAAFQNLFDSGH